MKTSFTLKLAGIAGQGIVSAGKILGAALVNSGYAVLVHDNYSAEIRGNGKSVTTLRIDNHAIYSMGNYTDLVFMLALKPPFHELQFLRKNAVIAIPDFLEDEFRTNYPDEWKSIQKYGVVPLPVKKRIKEYPEIRKSLNMYAVGFVNSIMPIGKTVMHEAIRGKFQHKNETVHKNAILAFEAGFEFGSTLNLHEKNLLKPSHKPARFINGNQATVKGALRGGLKFFAGYPITPATPIMEELIRDLPSHDGWGMQMEDEIASISAVVGASYAGAPAMTATSGPGFSLMGEMLNLAVMAEIPLVVVNVQRGGPATGMPTKSEQGDLNMAVYGGSGDAPRVVMAPTTIAECYSGIQLALQVAEKYQTPVVFLSDLYLGYLRGSVEKEHLQDMFQLKRLEPATGHPEEFARFRITGSGVSPMPIPGKHGAFYTMTGLEHNEVGRPNYDGDVHFAMTAKRHRKFESMLADLPLPEIHGDSDAEIGIIAWGSTWGPAYEATQMLRRNGVRAKILKSLVIFPLQTENILNFCRSVDRVFVPEVNFQGQFAKYLKTQINTEIKSIRLPSEKLVRPESIYHAVRENIYVDTE